MWASHGGDRRSSGSVRDPLATQDGDDPLTFDPI